MTRGALGVVTRDVFHLPIPLTEKIVRPLIVCLSVVVFLRLFGKRELAHLNPFDLVVLLSLSNTVQNAIVGDGSSVTGGILHTSSLLAVNWLRMNVLHRTPRLNSALEGTLAVLVRDGEVDQGALAAEKLSSEELISGLNRNGPCDPRKVDVCVLEPSGTFCVKGKAPSPDELQHRELMDALRHLAAEVEALRWNGTRPA